MSHGGHGGPGDPSPDRLVSLLASASRILVFTGAGISTSSGIPDFRGPGGVWERRKPVYYQEFMRSEAARLEYWDYKAEAREAYRRARPTGVHRAIVDLERAGKVAAVVTQNIDGLHAAAGTAAARLIELHGTDALVECQTCRERSDPAPHFAAFKAERRAPRCACGGLLKPATVSFGQPLREADLERARVATEAADLVLALGSTLSVYPAAAIPLAAAERGAAYVIVNRGPTDHDGHPAVRLRLEGDVEAILPPAVKAALASA